MGLSVTSWAGTFLYYIQLLTAHGGIVPSNARSGLELIIDFDNPQGTFEVDMESMTLNS